MHSLHSLFSKRYLLDAHVQAVPAALEMLNFCQSLLDEKIRVNSLPFDKVALGFITNTTED